MRPCKRTSTRPKTSLSSNDPWVTSILSAVEVVDPAVPSTLDAAALCKMADRGQITGGILDGLLAMDNATSALAAGSKHIGSSVSGHTDILIMLNLEAGNILSKNLTYLADADAAGVVVGARVPIILASRADPVGVRIASAALASILARASAWVVSRPTTSRSALLQRSVTNPY
jgi:phosphate acetyltransferase